MSALTKLFVVLLVILSMLLTAGTVVFVNKAGNLDAELKTFKEKVADAEHRLNQAKTEVGALTANKTQLQLQLNSQVAALGVAQGNFYRDLADKDKQIAVAASEKGLVQLHNSALTEALKASEEAKSKQAEEILAMRKTTDDLTKQMADAGAAISDLRNRLDATERERRNLAEDLVQRKNELALANDRLVKAGINIREAATGGTTALRINGVIRATRDINGVQYATISVGSADSVAKGMLFNVMNQDQAEWLGTLIVDSVEPNEATGRLDLKSPSVLGHIRPQKTEVRTQF